MEDGVEKKDKFLQIAFSGLWAKKVNKIDFFTVVFTLQISKTDKKALRMAKSDKYLIFSQKLPNLFINRKLTFVISQAKVAAGNERDSSLCCRKKGSVH